MNPNDDPNNQMPIDPNAQVGQDDLFPGFLNQPNDPSAQPDFLQDDQNQPQKPQQYIRAGSPEAPITVAVESQPTQSPEQGMESQESQEFGKEDRELVENKEVKKTQNDNDEGVKKPVVVKPVTPEVPQKGPQLYGYMVPPQIIKNFNLIRSRKLKGSPTASKTWLYVLLDRILKMHNQK